MEDLLLKTLQLRYKGMEKSLDSFRNMIVHLICNRNTYNIDLNSINEEINDIDINLNAIHKILFKNGDLNE